MVRVLLLLTPYFYAGWVGTERIWYFRIFRQDSMSLRDLVPITRSLAWPFVRLGILIWLPAAPF